MTKEVKPEDAARRIEKAINKIEKEMPSLKSILDPFKGLLVERAIIKAGISDRPDFEVPAPDPERFSEGVPLLTADTITSLMDPWGETVDLTVPPLAKAFPKVEPELMRLREALQKGEVDLKDCVGAFVGGEDEKLDEISANLGIQTPIMKFLLGQMLKPFVEKRSEGLRPLIEKLPWHKGYCPICGCLPELSFLEEREGQRWLRCALCGHEWRFDRMACPHCGSDNSKKRQLIYAEGRQQEWAELCQECKTYIVSADLRMRSGVVTEVAALGMVHLDIIAQRKGYSPVAVCAWNVVSDEK